MHSFSFGDRIRRLLWRLVPKRWLSGALGCLFRIPLPRVVRLPLLGLFARCQGIDASEAEHSLREYRSVHDLFVRRLCPGARPCCADPLAVCAPADGRVVETGLAEQGRVMSAKGEDFSLAELLADHEAARLLEGGPYHITYLSPGDYHRVHAPIAGRIVGWHHVPGRLFSVNQANLRREPGLFAKNERLVVLIDGDTSGPCACVLVAAFGVGNITLTCDPEVETHRRGFSVRSVRTKRFQSPPRVGRGDELGVFHMGSTVISVFSPAKIELHPVGSGQVVRVGQAIGTPAR
jgi:phosphatidylserine decarboxylase